MKKLMRKLLAVVAALTMVLGMAIPTMAATVTINPQTPTESTANAPTYTYYEMMKASIGTAAEGQQAPVSYYVDKEDLATALNGLKVENDDLFTVTKASGADRWNVTINKKAAGGDFTGEEVAAALDTIKDKAEATGKATNNSFVITGDGYVLVESSLGTKLVLDTVYDKEINEKNTYPSNTKTADKTSAEIGQDVLYTVTVDIPATANKAIKVVDTISKGLTMDESDKAITVGASVLNGDGTHTDASVDNVALASKWDGAATTNTDGSKVYTYTISEAAVKAYAAKAAELGKSVTLTLQYKATVNENAVRAQANTNKSHIEYDNFTSKDTEPTTTKTFGFDLTKIGNGDAKNVLKDVEFTLQNADGEYYTVPKDAANVNEDRFTSTKSTVKTDNKGQIKFDGLAAGTYTLTETKTNDGYNLLTAPLTITVGEDGNISIGTQNDNNTTASGTALTVNNVTGSALPSTGGMGTTIFYVLGAALVIGAGVVLVTRRRLSK